MSTAVGGSIESIELKGRTFPVASDADAQRNLGGFENEVQANGDGTARIIKTRMPWSLSGVQVQIDDNRADQEFLKDLQALPDFFNVAITLASGFTYQAKGQIVDKLELSTKNATASLSLMGPGEATAQ